MLYDFKGLLNDAGFITKELASAYWEVKRWSKSRQKIQIDQVNDITAPFIFKYSVFAKYRNGTKKLDCYHGALKKVHLVLFWDLWISSTTYLNK